MIRTEGGLWEPLDFVAKWDGSVGNLGTGYLQLTSETGAALWG